MQPLDVYFPRPLYSELHGCIAPLKWFVQGSSNVHVCAISMHPPSHPVAYPGEIKVLPTLSYDSAFTGNTVNIPTRSSGFLLSIPDIYFHMA